MPGELTSPHVVVSPAHSFGRSTVRGVSTELLADHYWLHGLDDLEDEYGLSRHELLVALWFEATQGRPRFRRRWTAWGAVAGQALWSGVEPDQIRLPPTGQPAAPKRRTFETTRRATPDRPG